MEFKQPITVIQLIKKELTYGKNLRAFDVRSKTVLWPQTIRSDNGAVRNGSLFLKPEIVERKNFSQARCIVLLDEVIVTTEQLQPVDMPDFEIRSSSLLLSEGSHLSRWDTFALHFQQETLTAFFEWDYFKVGLPARENHKLFDLFAPKTISLQVNGKIDSTLSAGTRRYYKEMEYFFIYYGQFTSYNYQRSPTQKQLTYMPDKKINMLKRLY